MPMILALLACGTTLAPAARDRPPPAGEPVRFIALGDAGRKNPTQARVAAAIGRVCAERPCDFALMLGDNLYPRGMDSDGDPRMEAVFTDVYGELGLEFKVVLGNHDYGFGEPERAARQVRFAARTPAYTLPSPTYTFSAGHADFVALDTDRVFFAGEEEQAAWLDEQLQRSQARWKVVFGHHPYRSNGKHGNAGSYEGWSNIPYLSGNALYRLFDEHVRDRADLYLSGHDHNLQVMRHEGLPLVVSGGGMSGQPLIDRGNTLDLGAGSAGFAWVELGTALTVELFDEQGEPLGRVRYEHPREQGD